MLSNREAGILAQMVAHIRGRDKLSKEQLEELADEADTAIREHVTAISRMAGAAALRPKRANSGRPPSTEYIVELNPRWTTTVLGTTAVHELVVATLEELGETYVPARSSIAAYMSMKGQWWRNIETDEGTLILSVKKVQPKVEKPSKPKGETGRQRLARKAKE